MIFVGRGSLIVRGEAFGSGYVSGLSVGERGVEFVWGGVCILGEIVGKEHKSFVLFINK
jgi:hypothetical protein